MLGDGSSFPQLAWVTFQSVLQVFFIALSGFYAATRGILPKKGQKIISMINVNLLTPCLIFSKLARTLSLSKLVELIIVPIFYAFLIGTSYCVASSLSKVCKFDKDESHFVIGNAVFPNSNSLPVSLIVSLAFSLPQLSWDKIKDDTPENVASRGILYLLMFQQIDQALRWSWGVHKLLRWSDREESQPLLSPSEENLMHNLRYETRLDKFASNMRYHWDNLLEYMNPPLYAIFFAVLVASIEPLQIGLFKKDSFLKNTISSAIDDMGKVSIPLILVILGANIAPSPSSPKPRRSSRTLVAAAIVSRIFLPSLIVLPTMTILMKNLQISILSDPVFVLVTFLLTASPPAIQLTQITSLNKFFEFEQIGVLFWSYTVLTLPVTIIVVASSMTLLNSLGIK